MIYNQKLNILHMALRELPVKTPDFDKNGWM